MEPTAQSIVFFFYRHDHDDFSILRDDGRLRAKWNRNAICRSPRHPSAALPSPRISLAKPSRDYANSGIIYFSFTLLLLSSSALPIVAQTKLYSSPSPLPPPTVSSTRATLESTNFEVPVGFWCSHQLFSPCKIVNHALSRDKATNNSSILNGHTEDHNARLHRERN